MAFDDPGAPATIAPDPLESFYFTLPPRRRRFQHRWWVHILLFAITVGTTALVGTEYYLSFLSAFGTTAVSIHPGALAIKGLVFSAAILGILGAHEMGHYIACRLYNVDATLPYFLPFPLLSISGTLGAVIKIREPFPSRRALFDIGIAGPIAGFLVLVPVLVLAVMQSNVVRAPDPTAGFAFGEPLLFQALVWLRFGHLGPGYQLNLHPVGFGAWFGMLATAWNLLPFGQLDGGHITFATLGKRARYISVATVAVSVGLCFVSTSWVVMTLMMLAMLYFLGPGHPPVMDDSEPLGRERRWLAAFAVVMFVICFTPVPLELIGR